MQPIKRQPTRRRFLQLTGAGLGATALSGTLGLPRPALAKDKVIKLGYVSPQTGPLALFAEADNFVVGGVREALKGGLTVGGKSYPVEIVVKDSQSNPNRAADVANDLIQSDQIDIMLVASTPETTNPVSDQCEVAGVPCISSVAPWQPWFFTRGGDPAKGFQYTYHFFWGLEDIIAVFIWSTTKRQGSPNPASGPVIGAT